MEQFILSFGAIADFFRDYEPVWLNILWVFLAFLVVLGIPYFIFVWLLGRIRLQEIDRQQMRRVKELKKSSAPKEEIKAAKSELSAPAKNVFTFNKMRPWLIPVVAVVFVVTSLASAILPLFWDAMWNAITGNAGVVVLDNESRRIAAAEANENVITVEREGITLLKNKDNALPLDKNVNNKVNIFGTNAYGMLLGNGGSGAFQIDIVNNRTTSYNGITRKSVRLEEALLEEGFEYNTNLFNLVKNYAQNGSQSIAESNYQINSSVNTYNYPEIAPTWRPWEHEPPKSAYEKTYDGLNGKTLLDDAADYSDTAIFCISRLGSEDGDLNDPEMVIKSEEKEILKMLRENFNKVIVLLNVSRTINISELVDETRDDYIDVDSILFVGHPGLTGEKAIAETLVGKNNPSGHLVDTWAFDHKSAPSYQCFGNNTTLSFTGGANGKFVVYHEGIYVGYRYYVTRGDTDPSFKYEDNVAFSFGHGLSYTTFNQQLVSTELDSATNTMKFTVSVTNTGSAAGKDVIQVYSKLPFTGRVEKSSRVLAGFTKTNVINPGETKSYEIDVKLRDLSSWDNELAEYVLEKGDYEFYLGKNVWDKQVDSTSTYTNSYKYSLSKDIEYIKSEYTGYEYANQFDELNRGPFSQPLEYLSRTDWEGTWKNTADFDRSTTNASLPGLNTPTFEYDSSTPLHNQQNNGLTLRDLKGADWDDPDWDDLLNQMSITEMTNLMNDGGFKTIAVDSIGKKAATDYDGPMAAFHSGTGHPSEVLLASSWNLDAAYLYGQSIGKEGAAAGLTGWYAPGMNIHRSPYGGRNFEYYSEDPLISGLFGGTTAQGAAEFGVYTYAKHFALNEQEQSRAALYTWCSEQAMREIYLRPFQIYVEQFQGVGIMSSFSRIGSVWSGGHRGMCTEVLRNEWGFHGVVVSDYNSSGQYMRGDYGIYGGNDLWLNRHNVSAGSFYTSGGRYSTFVYEAMRNSCKGILYACANSNNVWTAEEFADVGIVFE